MKKETLYRYFEGIASREEEEAVYRWLDVSPANEEELLREREFFDAMILVGNEEGHKLKQVHFFVREMLKVVAIVAITLACGGYYHLADKKELLSAMNTITVPMGQRMNLKLPDGTSVWLNACSEIVYPAIFSGGKREIRLTGEAYFEVTRQEKNPFVVRTERCEIEVLGTKFNVEAYSGSDDFSVALMEGAVKVSDSDHLSSPVLLQPDQEIRLKDGQWKVSAVSDYDHFRWREGLVCFKDVAFYELMARFEKCYGIQIIVENKHLKDYACSGKFRISDGVDNALRILQRNAKYTIERNEDNSIIYIK